MKFLTIFSIFLTLIFSPTIRSENIIDCKMGLFGSAFYCGVLFVKGDKNPPDILKLAKSFCEQQKKILRCDEIGKANHENEKYVVSCDYSAICERTALEAISPVNFVAKCIEGAFDTFEDYTKVYQYLKKSVKAKNAFLRDCDKKLACKRSISKGTAEFDNMSDETLNKYNSTYILHKKEFEDNQAQTFARTSRDVYDRTKDKRILNAEINREITLDKDQQAIDLKNFDIASAVLMGKVVDRAKKELEIQGITLGCYEQQTATRLLCHTVLTALIPAAALKVAVNIDQFAIKGIEKLKPHLERRGFGDPKLTHADDHRTLVRELHNEKYLNLRAASNEENANFIPLAESEIEVPGSYFLRIENAFLKMINDTLKDKNLVTSINNHYNELLSKNIGELLKNHPEIKMSIKEKLNYQGFKELEFNFKTASGKDLSEAFQKELDQSLKKSNNELDYYLHRNEILRKSDKPSDWYRAGLGRTGDQANIAARIARDNESNSSFVSFDDRKVRAKIEKAFKDARKLAREIEKEFPKDFLEIVEGTDFKVVNEDILALSRKFPKAEDLLVEIKKKTKNENISLDTVVKLKKFQEASDIFSPAVRTIVREDASFTLANGTQIGIDYRDVGALNAKEQMKAMLQSADVKDAIRQSRINFNKATLELDRRKDQFENILKEIVEEKKRKNPELAFDHAKSGDDGVAKFNLELTDNDMKKITKRWAELETKDGKKASSARLSLPNSRIKSKVEKNKIAAHGESVEKRLRERLNGKISSQNFNDLTVLIKMNGERSGVGKVDIYIATGGKNNLTRDEIKKIAEEFKEAVKDINLKGDAESKTSFKYVTNEFSFD